MGQVKTFIQRAPRYVLRPTDRSTMRFSFQNTQGAGGIESTLLINLSETGVAFLVNRGGEPRLGDRVKVEVPIPQGETIAWWGSVVRINLYEPRTWFGRDQFMEHPKVMVALRFEELPEQHTRAIRRGLNRAFLKAMREQQYKTLDYYKTLLSENWIQALVYFALTAFLVLFIYWFTLPSDTYDAKRGAQWGDRFKFFGD